MELSALIADLANLIVLFLMLGGLIRMILHGRRSMAVIFYAFSTASLTFSYIYWLIYDFMWPEERLVFAANEISEWAHFLMCGTVLAYMFKEITRIDFGEICGVMILVAVNVALWIAWTGEWLQDIVTGLCIAYWAYRLAIGVKESKTTTLPEWGGLVAGFMLTIGLQVASFFKGAPIKALYLASFLSLVIVVAFIHIKTIRILIRAKCHEDYRKAFCLALLIIMITGSGMYMSSEPYYTIFLASMVLPYTYSYIAIRKGADLA
ncbi:MAG: hypothetical protein J5872_04620 [Lachnospiraceae bacterium]|nr:hypothetical protein [Lachnospiraceae bacterium]